MFGPGRSTKRVLTERQSSENLPTPKRQVSQWTTPTRTKENRRPSNQAGASPSVGRRPSHQHHVSSSPFHQFKTPTRPPRSIDTAPNTPECYSKVEIGTPSTFRRASNSASSKSDDSDVSTSGNGFSVTVGVRVRPFNDREKADNDVKCVIGMDGNEVQISSRYGQPSHFCYDHCFWSVDKTSSDFSGQEAVYRAVGQPLLRSAFEGYNTCLFAYGQTGSGKSYTIMGSSDERGIIPRFCKDLYRRVEDPQETKVSFKVEVSFFEIYNEKIHDLLAPGVEKTDKWDKSAPKKITLKVREHPTQGPYVEGLSTFKANSYSDIHSYIERGNKQRATAATGMNDKSSRSHSVFVIMMTKTKKEVFDGEEHIHSVTSKINIIDLAGSERCAATNTTGDRLKEGANINRSLMTLGKVISGLSDKSLNPKKKVFIPYRDSVLTWLLRESLGGNSKTAMIATVSPASTQSEETLSTLRYAKQARSIINVAKVNEDPNARLIRELRTEIEKLKSMGYTTRGRRQSDEERNKNEELEGLKERLTDSHRRMTEMEEAWKERVREEETKRKKIESQQKELDSAFQVDNTLPNLVNLNEDPQLSEVLLYVLKDGETHIGRTNQSAPNGIHLNSALVEEDHCMIINNGSYVTVRPVNDAETFVNGDRIHRGRRLHHGDRVVVGNYYFRYNDPKEVRHAGQRSKVKVGFEFARNELANAQGSRLQSEKEEARLQTQKEMLKGIEEARKAAQKELETQSRNYERKIKELEHELRNMSVVGHKKEENLRQRTDNRVEELQQENKMLKQELESNRRRLELETREARKALEQGTTHHTRILQELEKEKERLLGSVEALQAAQRERKQRKGAGRVESGLQGRRDLLQLSMRLQEANNISTKLKRHLTFSRHDEQSSNLHGQRSEVTIRVNDTKKGLMTFWSLDMFEEKLLQMREAFQGNCTSREVDAIFTSKNGSWEKDFRLDSPIAHRQFTCSSRSDSSATTPARSSSTTNGQHLQSSAVANVNNSLDAITTSCLHHLATRVMRPGRREEEGEQTLADRTIGCMHRLLVAMETMRECSKTGDGKPIESSVLQTTISIDILNCLSNLWATLVHRQDEEHSQHRPHQAKASQSLVEQMEDCSQKLAKQIYEMIQNVTKHGNRDNYRAASEMQKDLIFSSRILGELCFITDTPCWFMGQGEHDEDKQIDFKLKQGFLDGADVFVDKTIQESLTAIGQFEMQLRSTLHDHNLKGEVKKPLDLVLSISTSAKILLNKTQEAQLELSSTQTSPPEDQSRPGSYYSQSYARSLGLSGEIHDLRSHIQELYDVIVTGWKGNQSNDPESGMIGSEFDPLKLRLPTDALLVVVNRLPQAASTKEVLGNQSNRSALSDTSTTSSMDGPCRPTDLVRLASRQLLTHLRALQGYIRATVRKSRIPTDADTGARRNKHVRFAEHLNKKAFIYKYSSMSSSDTDTSGT
ncbi:kinesin-like protein KIF14 isoform X2 [Strongylocentrotus purpuratus]|uniref:Kinesin-like protein KIF14 n=1 Tax=Strongylocentrotus purpuratus TaxID=7668 RepID=A0A7M7HNR8_STRPU|nr:kinesin-like protein KIF14 isoform X2 [Strongylocentrotus purpuratus]